VPPTNTGADVPDTHDRPTRSVLGQDLDHTMVLVWESGGMSAIYESNASSTLPGMRYVKTEHGPLYLDPYDEYLVLDA
jgi:hypothetical protein